MKKLTAVAFALMTLACTTQQQSPTVAPVAANPEFKNLQVLPKDLTRDQLMTIMRSFTQGLGVKCNECHVVTATKPREQLDFASDAKKDKLAARVMIQTTMELNTRWIPRVKAAEGKASEPGEMEVFCWTCHRGKKEPEKPPVPAARPS
jgi:hypothetical protein